MDSDKVDQQDKPELALTPIWRCRSSGCKAWMREEMVEADHPECPICHETMIHSYKHLPKLTKKRKAAKKKTSALVP